MSIKHLRTRRAPTAAALLAALALTGCAADADDGAEDKPDASGGAETTADAATSEEPPPSAADGTDYSNCSTQCEVEVETGTVFEFEAFTLTVTEVTEDGIEVSRDDGDGSTGTSGMSGGYCIDYLTANSSQGSCYGVIEGEPPAPTPAAGELALELLGATDGTAIVRLTWG